MSGNAVYKQSGEKGQGFLSRLYKWGHYFTEDELSGNISDRDNLLENIHQARQEWLSVVANFEQAENEDMVDYYIYRMKACQIRYNYLLKLAKETGLRQNGYKAQ